MNGLTARNKTLGELMNELRARLGFVAQGAASKGNDAIIKSFLQEAHDYVYSELEMSSLRKKATIAIDPGSYLYDWNNDAEDEPIDPSRVISMWLRVSESQRDPLRQGITESMRAMETERSQPTRYDHLNGQIELYPVPDRGYGLIIEYTADVLQVDDSYRTGGPSDWTWPPGRFDQWGVSKPPSERIKQAQKKIRFTEP